jgi:RNA polymerase sigma factor (TIGR02999 family)
MNDVTRLLQQIGEGDPMASEQLMPLLYDVLRKIAAKHLAGARPDHTLQPTALVHEAYMRLVGNQPFENRSHFYSVASMAMRQILVDNARRRKSLKRGGNFVRQDHELDRIAAQQSDDQLLALDEALQQFAIEHPRRAKLVELRYFSGMTLEEASQALGISIATCDRDWKYARAWLYTAMNQQLDENNR